MAIEPKFGGVSFVVIVQPDPKIGFLEGDFGRAVHEEVIRRYPDNPAITVVKYLDGRVQGSNSFYVVAVNDTELFRQQNLRTVKQPDLEMALKSGRLPLSGTYEDTGLVLRSEDNPNQYLAKNLARQLRSRNPQLQYPILVSSSDLSLRVDPDSPQGLAFVLREDAKPIYVPILNSPNGSRFSSEDIDETTGLPNRVGTGSRYLYTRTSGLARLCLGRGLDLDSNDDGLASSSSGGRVVVVSGVATQKNF